MLKTSSSSLPRLSEPPKARKADPNSHPNAGLRATNSRAPDSLQHPKQLGRRLLQHNPPETALAAYFVLISELSPRRLTVRLATGASLAVGRAVSSVKKSVARRQPIDRPANDSWEARSDRQISADCKPCKTGGMAKALMTILRKCSPAAVRGAKAPAKRSAPRCLMST